MGIGGVPVDRNFLPSGLWQVPSRSIPNHFDSGPDPRSKIFGGVLRGQSWIQHPPESSKSCPNHFDLYYDYITLYTPSLKRCTPRGLKASCCWAPKMLRTVSSGPMQSPCYQQTLPSIFR